ncbi:MULTISPECIES: DUF2235 domain-containing protein [unclassified Pseudomonas]|uniref:phospholipase effector Tle1 domain-containing protein n=1 Tax=unclassified Pseudomonas TaxID=196821 RepID=UPI000CE5F34C|nr:MULTISPECIES: DUF2235 domain-containing protein [unclassified Pseudomonas]AVD86342.1 type IV secretion protein Rhs [Pseudomonas sp. SWI44]WEZ90132.1 DUF2235 domain-containing protein [Pseudomonas sp. NyZ480]
MDELSKKFPVFTSTKPYVLRIGIFFDGTGNNARNAVTPDSPTQKYTTGSYANAPTNIALLHTLYPTGQPQATPNKHFMKLYIEGIGTTEASQDSTFAQATGRGQTGVEARVQQALAMVDHHLIDCLHTHPHPHHIEFDLFGFSRGAAAARHLLNRLHDDTPICSQYPHLKTSVNFIGLFDTVAAITAPLHNRLTQGTARFGKLRLGLAQGCARHVVQLVASDERRHNFPLVRTDHDIHMPGVHSNIGGGYPQAQQESVLLCKPNASRVALTTPAERTRAYAITRALLEQAYKDLPAPKPQLLTWEAPIAGSRSRRDDPEKQVYAAVQWQREVKGQLSRIYLSVMRELAVRGGVPFANLGNDPAHQLPDDLHTISRKLHDFALGHSADPGLTQEETAQLREKYIHTSANWNALKGLCNSTLDQLYIDRPAEAGRVMHSNPVQ